MRSHHVQIKKVDALPGSGAWPSYNERFQRMWDFYLCNCEAEFTTGHFGLGQFILRAPSKDYRGEVRLVATPPHHACAAGLIRHARIHQFIR